MILAIILGLLVLLAIFMISSYNGLVKLREMVRNSMVIFQLKLNQDGMQFLI